jgi:hypothetical protein
LRHLLPSLPLFVHRAPLLHTRIQSAMGRVKENTEPRGPRTYDESGGVATPFVI